MSAILKIPELPLTLEQAERLHLTADQYLAMTERGVFDGFPRIELVEGAILRMAPQGLGHVKLVARATEKFIVALHSRGYKVHIQSTQPVGKKSTLEPDVMIYKPENGEESEGFPELHTIRLVIEISESSQRHDRQVKLPIYAAAAIPEYWLVDLKSCCVEVYRQPLAAKKCFADIRIYTRAEVIALGFEPDVKIALSDLLKGIGTP